MHKLGLLVLIVSMPCFRSFFLYVLKENIIENMHSSLDRCLFLLYISMYEFKKKKDITRISPWESWLFTKIIISYDETARKQFVDQWMRMRTKPYTKSRFIYFSSNDYNEFANEIPFVGNIL